jgi:hypothetical protein
MEEVQKLDSEGFQSPQNNDTQQPLQPPKKKRGTLFWLVLLIGILLVIVLGGVIINAISRATASTPVQSEQAYKDSAMSTIVDVLDKDGNADQGKVVQFTCQLNEGDILTVWGTDNGVSSGQNAFGATVQEVVVTAQYLTDQTTGCHIDFCVMVCSEKPLKPI